VVEIHIYISKHNKKGSEKNLPTMTDRRRFFFL